MAANVGVDAALQQTFILVFKDAWLLSMLSRGNIYTKHIFVFKCVLKWITENTK